MGNSPQYYSIETQIINEIIRSINISLNILNAERIWTSECSLWKKLVNKNISEKCVDYYSNLLKEIVTDYKKHQTW